MICLTLLLTVAGQPQFSRLKTVALKLYSMNTATIKVQYVNAPKSPKGPGSVKTEDGVYYKVWPKAKEGGATLSQFEAGRTYEIEFDTEQYNGRDTFTARKILSSSESTNGSGAGLAHNSQVAPESSRSAHIERQCALKVAAVLLTAQVQAGKDEPTVAALFSISDDIVRYINGEHAEPVEQEVEI